MPDDNLPAAPGTVDDAPMSFDTATDKLADIFTNDPATDPAPKVEDKEHQDAAQTPVEDDDPLGMNVEAEDAANTENAEAADGPQDEIKGGRFAPDSAKVKLDDGTVISVADLKRNNLFQRDYTGKTQALSEERKSLDAERAAFSQQAQSLDQFREYAAWYAEQFLPKQPAPFQGDPADDPMGYMKWSKDRDQWLAHAQAYQAFQLQKQQDEEAKKAETSKQFTERHRKEQELLLKAIPVLKDPVKGKQVWGALVAGAQEHYGMSEEEVNSITDHRFLVGLRDAIAYRRLKAQAPQVQAQVAQRPAVRQAPRGGTIPAAKQERQVRSERLQKTGSIEDAAAVLKTFDL